MPATTGTIGWKNGSDPTFSPPPISCRLLKTRCHISFSHLQAAFCPAGLEIPGSVPRERSRLGIIGFPQILYISPLSNSLKGNQPRLLRRLWNLLGGYSTRVWQVLDRCSVISENVPIWVYTTGHRIWS